MKSHFFGTRSVDAGDVAAGLAGVEPCAAPGIRSGRDEAFRSRRVVLVAHSHVLGGIERHVVGLATALAQRGHEVAFAGPLDGWLGEQMRRNGHPCVHLPMHGMFDPVSAWRLTAFAKGWRADLLHGHAQRGGRYADWAARWSGIAAVVTAHSTNAGKWFTRRWPIVAVSSAVRDHLLTRGLPPSLIKIVYPGIADVGLRPPLPGTIGLGRPLMLGMVARVERVKGQDIALEALARVRQQLPARLLLAGAQTSWTEQLREHTRALNLVDHVEFLGQRQDVAALLEGLDLVLAPSRRESLCLSLVEAASAGRTCVAARVGGIPEVVANDATGLLVPPEDAMALAAGILRLAANEPLRNAWGIAARQRFERLFTVNAMIEGTETVYSSAVDAHQVSSLKGAAA